VLDLVDRKVNHFEFGTIATVACAGSDPPYDTMTIAVAGHPSPVVAIPGQPPSLAETAPSPPIGTHFTSQRSSTTITLAPGAVVAFYTDGLIERRGESLDVGLQRLRDVTSPGAPESVAHEIMRTLIGASSPADDIALVVVRRTTQPLIAGGSVATELAVPYDATGPAVARRFVHSSQPNSRLTNPTTSL
jgi:serine phosphatase RsbU (regulator of sigma subunit)